MIYNDGSTDQTVKNVKRFLNKKIFLISNPSKNGWVKMYQTTINKTSKEYLVFFPGDNAYSTKKLCEFFSNYNHYDCVFGKRVNYYDELSFLRSILSKILNFMMNLFLYVKVQDFHSSHIYKKKILRKKIHFAKKNACWLEVSLNVTKKVEKYTTKELYLRGGHAKKSEQMSFKNLYNLSYSFLMLVFFRLFHIKNF